MKYFPHLIITLMLGLLSYSVGVTYLNTPALSPEPKTRQLQLEVANTPELRAKGLSGHAPLPLDTGMLFIFERAEIQCFWNKDVNFPVYLGFFTDDWKLINAVKMEANSEKKVCSATPTKLAIEKNLLEGV